MVPPVPIRPAMILFFIKVKLLFILLYGVKVLNSFTNPTTMYNKKSRGVIPGRFKVAQ